MKKKKENKGKRALTAVGAVVVAGLAPGIIGASPVQDPNAGVSAAEVVAIDGKTFDFDELYDKQQKGNRRGRGAASKPKVRPITTPATRYGGPSTVRPTRPPGQPSTLYGVQRPPRPSISPQEEKAEYVESLVEAVEMSLMDYCALLIDADSRGVMISPNSDLTRELGLTDDDLKTLKAEIEDRYGVEVSHYRFRLKGQLNTLHLIAEYIVKLKTIWD